MVTVTNVCHEWRKRRWLRMLTALQARRQALVTSDKRGAGLA
jgi:hypothetical protein